jgi:hypothetical protein
MNSAKTDEYGTNETLQISKNIERNIAHFKTLMVMKNTSKQSSFKVGTTNIW